MASLQTSLLAIPTLALAMATAQADEAEAAAETAAAGTATDEAGAATEETYTYTWEELVELIPELREMKLVEVRPRRRGVPEVDELPVEQKVCRRESIRGTSHIKRRVCYSLDEFVARYIEQRQAYDDIRRGLRTDMQIESGPGITTMSARCPRC